MDDRARRTNRLVLVSLDLESVPSRIDEDIDVILMRSLRVLRAQARSREPHR
jgi:hypothetical protein